MKLGTISLSGLLLLSVCANEPKRSSIGYLGSRPEPTDQLANLPVLTSLPGRPEYSGAITPVRESVRFSNAQLTSNFAAHMTIDLIGGGRSERSDGMTHYRVRDVGGGVKEVVSTVTMQGEPERTSIGRFERDGRFTLLATTEGAKPVDPPRWLSPVLELARDAFGDTARPYRQGEVVIKANLSDFGRNLPQGDLISCRLTGETVVQGRISAVLDCDGEALFPRGSVETAGYMVLDENAVPIRGQMNVRMVFRNAAGLPIMAIVMR